MTRDQLHPRLQKRSKRYLSIRAWVMFLSLSPFALAMFLYEGFLEYWDALQTDLYEIDQLEDV